MYVCMYVWMHECMHVCVCVCVCVCVRGVMVPEDIEIRYTYLCNGPCSVTLVYATVVVPLHLFMQRSLYRYIYLCNGHCLFYL